MKLTDTTIDNYLQEILEKTGILQLEESQAENYRHQIRLRLEQAVTTALIKKLSGEELKQFENLMTSDPEKGFRLLLEKNPDYEATSINTLNQFKEKFLASFIEEVQKHSK